MLSAHQAKEAHSSGCLSSCFTHCGNLNRHAVVDARTACFQSKWLTIALAVAVVVGLSALALGIMGLLAHQGILSAGLTALADMGPAGFISLMAGGGTLFLASAITLIVKKRHATAPLNQIILGSPNQRLDFGRLEQQLALHLVQTNETDSVDCLVIYGEEDLELAQDPGIVPLNPKKLILVGPKIVQSASFHIDRLLCERPEWYSKDHSQTFGGFDKLPHLGGSWVKQLIVSSVGEAIRHKPPCRNRQGDPYHVVYVVQRE